jgi:hypothetical protein
LNRDASAESGGIAAPSWNNSGETDGAPFLWFPQNPSLWPQNQGFARRMRQAFKRRAGYVFVTGQWHFSESSFIAQGLYFQLSQILNRKTQSLNDNSDTKWQAPKKPSAQCKPFSRFLAP